MKIERRSVNIVEGAYLGLGLSLLTYWSALLLEKGIKEIKRQPVSRVRELTWAWGGPSLRSHQPSC